MFLPVPADKYLSPVFSLVPNCTDNRSVIAKPRLSYAGNKEGKKRKLKCRKLLKIRACQSSSVSWCSHEAAAGDNPGATARLRVTSSLHCRSPEFSVRGEQRDLCFCSAALRRGKRERWKEGLDLIKALLTHSRCKRLPCGDGRVSTHGLGGPGNAYLILPKFIRQTSPSITGAGVKMIYPIFCG